MAHFVYDCHEKKAYIMKTQKHMELYIQSISALFLESQPK